MITMKRSLRIMAVLVLLSLTLVLSSAGIVGAQTNVPENGIIEDATQQGVVPQGGGPVPGGPGFVALSPFDFQPRFSTYAYSYGLGLTNTSGVTEFFYAPVQLPQNAVVNKMVLYFVDNSATDNITATLFYLPYLAEAGYPMTSAVSNNQLTTPQYLEATSITTPQVNNSINSYLVSVTLHPTPDVRLLGVRIDYGFPTSLPVIIR